MPRPDPVLTTLADLEALVRGDEPLYLRYSEGPDHDRDGGSVDSESGLRLPGLSVNPLAAESWWTRPLADWLARQICQCRHLREAEPDRYAWVLTGRVAGHGPDCEPLIADAEPRGTLAESVLDEAAERYEREFDAGRGPAD